MFSESYQLSLGYSHIYIYIYIYCVYNSSIDMNFKEASQKRDIFNLVS